MDSIGSFFSAYSTRVSNSDIRELSLILHAEELIHLDYCLQELLLNHHEFPFPSIIGSFLGLLIRVSNSDIGKFSNSVGCYTCVQYYHVRLFHSDPVIGMSCTEMNQSRVWHIEEPHGLLLAVSRCE
jgi:hypothetical protein